MVYQPKSKPEAPFSRMEKLFRSNASAKLGGSGIFLQRKARNAPKKFHGMSNAFLQSKPFPMKFFRGVLCFSLFKKNSTVTSFTDAISFAFLKKNFLFPRFL